MKKQAFTLAEVLIVLVVIGIIATVVMSTLKPTKVKEQALNEAGKAIYVRLDATARQIIAKHTRNYTLGDIKDSSGEFSIASSGNLARTVAMFKKYMKALRSNSVSSTYLNTVLTDANATIPISGLKPSSFSGYTLKNGAYMGIRLYNNCTTSETKLFNPYLPSEKTQSNSCGQIFFDVNGDEFPNRLGVDQYIVSLKLVGVR